MILKKDAVQWLKANSLFSNRSVCSFCDLICKQGSKLGFLHRQADFGGNLGTVLVVDLVEVCYESFLDVSSAFGEGARDVVNQVGAISVVKHLPEKRTGLLVVVVGVLVRVSASGALNRMLMPGVLLVLNRTLSRAWLVVLSAASVAIDAHLTITDGVSSEASPIWAVDRNLIVVDSKTMTVGIGVVEESALKHLVI